MKKLFIICFLSLTVISLSFCRKDVNGPIDEIPDPPAERTIDWVIQNRPQDLVAVVGVFPGNVQPGGGNVQKLVLFDYYNPQNYKIATDTTYRVVDPVFSRDKTKIIFGDIRKYIPDYGPRLVLYDLVADTIRPLNDQYGDRLVGVDVVWDANGVGFYFSYEYPHPAAEARPVFYYDLLSGEQSLIYTNFPWMAYPVDLLPPDTLIVFSNDTVSTVQQEGYYYMSASGEFLARINNEHLVHYREDAEYPQNLYPYRGNLRWYDDIQLFLIDQPGVNFMPGTFFQTRIAFTSREGSVLRPFPTNPGYIEIFIGRNGNTQQVLSLKFDSFVSGVGIWGYNGKSIFLRNEAGSLLNNEFIYPEIIPTCIAFAYADF